MHLLFDRRGVPAGELSQDELVELLRFPVPPSDAWLRTNFVATVDGSITGPDASSGSISPASDQHHFALHRALCDAVVVAGLLTLVFGAVVALAHCVWLGNLSTLVVDVVPRRTLATTFGFIGAGSAAGGILMNKLVVWAIGSYSYDRVFFVMACLHPLALLLVWPLRKPPREKRV